MPRNILCLIICVLLCACLMGCSEGESSSDNGGSPSISTTLGENPMTSLIVGETTTIAFKVDTSDPVFQNDFSVSVSDSSVAEVSYSKISGNYVYYKVEAKAPGVAVIYLEMPSIGIRSEAVTVNVSYASPDKIHASLGETPMVSIPEGSGKTVCFYIGEGIAANDVIVNISNESLASVSYVKKSGAYFYYRIDGLSKGSVEIYAEIESLGLESERITVNIVEKGTLPGYEEMTEGYICNTNSKTFHKPTCSYAQKINDANKVIFDSDDDRQEIINQGYTPCKSCNP